MGYGSGHIHLLFNLWYGGEYKASGYQHEPQVDHIFARSLLKDQKKINEETGRQVRIYENWEIDQLANCMLLPAKPKTEQVIKGTTIRQNGCKTNLMNFRSALYSQTPRTLWKVENYPRFIEKRKKLIQQRIEQMGLLESEE